MKHTLMILVVFLSFGLNFYAAQDCPLELPSEIGGSSIDMWGDNYQPCIHKQWQLYFPDDYQYALLEYQIDINNSGFIDFVKVYVNDSINGETEVLGYNNTPMSGTMQIRTFNSSVHVEYLGGTDEYNNLYKGFKISLHAMPDSAHYRDQIFYSNVGIGIYPQERLHIKGAIRGDGMNGALRIKTRTGSTELGAQNGMYSHFYTDRPAFYFNKPLTLAQGQMRTLYGSPLSLVIGSDTMMSIQNEHIYMYGNTHAQSFTTNHLQCDTLIVSDIIRGGHSCGSVRIKTDYGWGEFGSTHSGFFHFYTDRDKFYFDKTISINGGVISSIERVDLQLQTFNTTHLRIQYGTGNVGIGKASPQYKLDVAGKIHSDTIITSLAQTNELQSNQISSSTINTNRIQADSIQSQKIKTGAVFVESVYGADYVFDDNFQLRPLQEVYSFVQEHGHLPEIQSAEDMQQNGVNMSEFQIQLLQKIEELTLYIIHQEERIKELENQVSK